MLGLLNAFSAVLMRESKTCKSSATKDSKVSAIKTTDTNKTTTQQARLIHFNRSEVFPETCLATCFVYHLRSPSCLISGGQPGMIIRNLKFNIHQAPLEVKT